MKERWYGFDDGVYAGARLIEILANQDKSPQEVFDALPNSVNTPELRMEFNEGEHYTFMDKLVTASDFPDGSINTIDGLRVDFADGTMCHTGYRPLALVWAKRKGSKMTEINEMATPEETRNFETVRRLHATSPEGMELDALKSAAAIAWGWLWHVTTEDDRVTTARHLLGQFLPIC